MFLTKNKQQHVNSLVVRRNQFLNFSTLKLQALSSPNTSTIRPKKLDDFTPIPSPNLRNIFSMIYLRILAFFGSSNSNFRLGVSYLEGPLRAYSQHLPTSIFYLFRAAKKGFLLQNRRFHLKLLLISNKMQDILRLKLWLLITLCFQKLNISLMKLSRSNILKSNNKISFFFFDLISRSSTWNQRAAQNNQSRAQYLLSTLYETGRKDLLKKDSALAFHWLQKAANNG